jgi:hypothetical protein
MGAGTGKTKRANARSSHKGEREVEVFSLSGVVRVLTRSVKLDVFQPDRENSIQILDLEEEIESNGCLNKDVTMEVTTVPLLQTPAAVSERVVHTIEVSPSVIRGRALRGPMDNKTWIGSKTLVDHLARHNQTQVRIQFSIAKKDAPADLLKEDIPIITF